MGADQSSSGCFYEGELKINIGGREKSKGEKGIPVEKRDPSRKTWGGGGE